MSGGTGSALIEVCCFFYCSAYAPRAHVADSPLMRTSQTRWLGSTSLRLVSSAALRLVLFVKLILDHEGGLDRYPPLSDFVILNDCTDVLDLGAMDAGNRHARAGKGDLNGIFN